MANDFKLISTIYRAYKREIIQVSVDNEILVVRELTNSPNEVERLKKLKIFLEEKGYSCKLKKISEKDKKSYDDAISNYILVSKERINFKCQVLNPYHYRLYGLDSDKVVIFNGVARNTGTNYMGDKEHMFLSLKKIEEKNNQKAQK